MLQKTFISFVSIGSYKIYLTTKLSQSTELKLQYVVTGIYHPALLILVSVQALAPASP